MLVGGVAVTPDFFWWGVGCVYAGITLLAVDAYYEPWIRKWKNLGKAALVVLFMAIYAIFTLKVVWVPAPLKISAFLNSSTYPTGSTQYGIPWSSRFSKLHVILDNQTSMDYEAIDILLNPNEPIAGIGQESGVPNVSFIMNTEIIELIAGFHDSPSGKKESTQLTPLAVDSGYRVRCEKLPKNSLLKIVLAIGRPTGKEGLALSVSDGTHYWARAGIDKVASLDDYFETQTIPNLVQIDGEYVAARRMRSVKLVVALSGMLDDNELPNTN